MNKKVKWGLIAFIACGLVVWGVYSQLPKLNSELAQADKVESGDKAKKNILNVNALKVRTGVLTDEFTVSGNLLPDEEVDLSFETSGQVVEIGFKEGSHVTKGQLLAKVNDRQLQAELKRLQAQLKLANDRVYRQRTLLQHDAVRTSTYGTRNLKSRNRHRKSPNRVNGITGAFRRSDRLAPNQRGSIRISYYHREQTHPYHPAESGVFRPGTLCE